MMFLLLLCITALQILRTNGDCFLGRENLPETDPNPAPGLFIDLDSPASCSGQIIRWRVCYYNSRNFNMEDHLQIGLEVWRLDMSRRRGIRVGVNTRTVTIPPVPETFQCINIQVDEDDYINVTSGDFLGIVTTRDAVLPVVGNVQGRLLFLPSEGPFVKTELNNDPGLTTISSNVIHVTAQIEQPPGTGPDQDMTEETVPGPGAGGGGSSPGGSGLSPGAIVGVVMVMLLLAAVVVVAIIVGLVLFTRQRRHPKDGNAGFSLDNAAYDLQPVTSSTLHVGNSVASLASTYEIPVSTNRRMYPPASSHQAAEGGANIYSQAAEGGANIYSSVEGDFSGSFESANRDEISSSGFNPYATLSPVSLAYYNIFFEKATSAIYATPNNTTKEVPFHEPPNDEKNIYKELSKRTWTIRRKEIKMLQKIGEGAFSSVSKGVWTRMGTDHEVAVKSLTRNSSEMNKIKFLQEAAIMGQFQHPNIVKLFGVIKHGNSPLIVTEFLHKGDLLKALKELRPDPGQLVSDRTPQRLLSYSQQVSLGMHYLSSKGFVHRDLAARNIFVTKDNICKVGDFGMSRDLADTDYYVSRGGAVPVRWTSPEAIFYRKYSTASDVWSYGCLLYEVWTLGMRPYEGIVTTKYLETLQVGYRLPPPPGCPLSIYTIMIECWHPEANQRPSFSEILSSSLKEKEEMMLIPEGDLSTHKHAGVLGASLEAGLEMYKDLQKTYLKKQKTAQSTTKKKCGVTMSNSTDAEVSSLNSKSELTQSPYKIED